MAIVVVGRSGSGDGDRGDNGGDAQGGDWSRTRSLVGRIGDVHVGAGHW